MGLFAWNEIYSLGHPQIDREHKALFGMAEELHNAMLGGRGKEALTGLLSSLIDYTRLHFDHEEGLMRAHCYPGMEQHIGLHRALTTQVQALQTKFAAGNVMIAIEVMEFLRSWLDHHIRESDQLVAKHIRASENALSCV